MLNQGIFLYDEGFESVGRNVGEGRGLMFPDIEGGGWVRGRDL